jgi:signal transduction histidine kinase
MRLQSRVWVALLASVLVSAAVAFFVFSILQGISRDLSRIQQYNEVLDKAFGLNILIASIHGGEEPSPRIIQQANDIQQSLTRLLATLHAAEPREEALLGQVRQSTQGLGSHLDQIFDRRDAADGRLEAERIAMLASQLWLQVRFVTDKTANLMTISQQRIAVAQQHATWLVLVLIGILILTNGAISFAFSRRTVQDVQRLAEGVRQVAAGNLTQRIAPRGASELADLGRGFNAMAEHLAAYTASLTGEIGERQRAEEALRRSNEELELRVAERTKALAQAKDETEQRVIERTAELSRALHRVSVQSAQLRSLASDLTLVEQRERSRLAEQIHDGLQQLLVAARYRVTQLGRGETAALRQDCQAIIQLLDEAVTDARSLTAELSPPILRTGGLLGGLEWLARWCQEKHHLTVQITAPATPLPPLPEDLTVLLFQSVRELLFNAVKYAQVPEATVTLVWEPPGLTLTVADAGAGFDPHGLRGEGGGGGGFGLARIRHRLELLGGCMSLGSAPGKGTRVTLAVLVPTAEQPATPRLDTELMASPQPALASAPGSPRPIRILLVDDHRVVRQALAQLLRAEADLEVVGEAGTGTAAVALARQLTPEVVLMDINMPEMNGIEATRTIHAAFPAMRVIGLSMHDRGDQQAAMQAAGAVAYVSKSGPAEALLAAIRGER